MRTNYKNLKYSWETDPKVKAWKDACNKHKKDYPFISPTRIQVDGEWVFSEPDNPPAPKDVRSVEQFNNDWFIRACENWDTWDKKKHLRRIQTIKNKIRSQLIRIHKIKSGKRNIVFIRPMESELSTLNWLEYMEKGITPEYKIHWTEYVDYVNVRFGLKIRKDVLTDYEVEKSKLIVDLVPVLEGSNKA
tara:strand:+ start:69 stop:638 length:570 start_codon:yes stop_codon:yes gene_type:complete